MTPHPRVNGHALIVAESMNHGRTAEFYGRGTVARIDQAAGCTFVRRRCGGERERV